NSVRPPPPCCPAIPWPRPRYRAGPGPGQGSLRRTTRLPGRPPCWLCGPKCRPYPSRRWPRWRRLPRRGHRNEVDVWRIGDVAEVVLHDLGQVRLPTLDVGRTGRLGRLRLFGRGLRLIVVAGAETDGPQQRDGSDEKEFAHVDHLDDLRGTAE